MIESGEPFAIGVISKVARQCMGIQRQSTFIVRGVVEETRVFQAGSNECRKMGWKIFRKSIRANVFRGR